MTVVTVIWIVVVVNVIIRTLCACTQCSTIHVHSWVRPLALRCHRKPFLLIHTPFRCHTTHGLEHHCWSIDVLTRLFWAPSSWFVRKFGNSNAAVGKFETSLALLIANVLCFIHNTRDLRRNQLRTCLLEKFRFLFFMGCSLFWRERSSIYGRSVDKLDSFVVDLYISVMWSKERKEFSNQSYVFTIFDGFWQGTSGQTRWIIDWFFWSLDFSFGPRGLSSSGLKDFFIMFSLYFKVM